MIINNNNNNNGGPGVYYGQTFPGKEAQPQVKRTTETFTIPTGYTRESMIFLAKYLGWSGWHYFHFGKPILGAIHLLLSLIGIIGVASLFYILVLVDRPGLYLKIAIYLIPAFLIAILSGVICSFYWSMKDDETFRESYPDKQKKTETEKTETVETVDVK